MVNVVTARLRAPRDLREAVATIGPGRTIRAPTCDLSHWPHGQLVRPVECPRPKRPNVALGALDAPNVAFGALDAPKATLGRMRAGVSAGRGWRGTGPR